MSPALAEEAKSLLTVLRAVPGLKLVTLAGQVSSEVFDVHANGTVGCAPEHERVFLRHLEENLIPGGALVVRQRIPETGQLGIDEQGQRCLRYACAVYGAFLGKGNWFPVTADGVEASFETEPDSEEVDEERLIFRDLNDFCRGAPRQALELGGSGKRVVLPPR
jgi:hypothetical protein